MKKKHTNIRLQVAALALLLASAIAAAGVVDARAQSNRSQHEQAKQAYKDARKALNDGQYRNAAEMFAQVYQEHRDTKYAAEALYYQAFALNRLGGKSDLREARRALEIYIEKYSDSGNLQDATALHYKVLEQLADMGDREAAERLVRETDIDWKDEREKASEEELEERFYALQALINMRSDRALTILKEIFDDRDPKNAELRVKAVWLLSQTNSDEAVDLLVKIAKEDPDQDVREQAVFWLSQTHDERAVAFLEEMLLESDDPEIQEKAVFALSQVGDDRAFATLQKIALDEKKPDNVREQAIFWLGQQGGREQVAFLKDLFYKLDDADLKEKVLFSVSQNSRSGDWLMEVVRDEKESTEVRKQALFWAGQSGSIDVAVIVDVYKKSKNMEMREQAVFALSQSHSDEAIKAMVELARTEKNRELRKQLIFWIGQSGHPAAEDFLLEIIND